MESQRKRGLTKEGAQEEGDLEEVLLGHQGLRVSLEDVQPAHG